MARWMEPTTEQVDAYREWVASRPDNVRLVAERLEPWSVYYMLPPGKFVVVQSFGEEEDGRVTLTVGVLEGIGTYHVAYGVFGCDPARLSPCDMPKPTDLLVSGYNWNEAKA
jgi:hypothetical protein